MKNIKRIFQIMLVALFSFVLVACGSSNDSAESTESETVVEKKDFKIGISMPSKSLERWEKDGSFMVAKLKELGYETDIQYAQDGVSTQVSQIENQITTGVDVLVIAAIDGEALSDVIGKAKNEGIPVIAYDRLLMNSDGVDYYTTFDLLEVGRLQGQYIVDKLDLENEAGPFNIELFAGAPDDNNAHLFFEGAMSALQPYIDEEKLNILSGQVDFNQVATMDWNSAKAQERMDNILSANYTSQTIDAVLTQNDALAIGVVSSLESVGYGSEDRPMPIITGQDAEAASIKSIKNGGQTMTVFKDTEALAGVAVNMIEAILNGEEVEVNDTETYDNNVIVVPAFLLEPVAVDIDNYQEIVIDSGYIDASEIE